MLTLVWLLSSVSSDVNGQGTPLNEALPAAGDRARIRSLIGMYPVVSLQIGFAIKALATSVSLVEYESQGVLKYFSA